MQLIVDNHLSSLINYISKYVLAGLDIGVITTWTQKLIAQHACFVFGGCWVQCSVHMLAIMCFTVFLSHS